MHWSKSIQLVDVHCEGEIGRIVTGGVLDVPGASVADKLAHINHTDDSLRRLLTREPRGGPAGSVVLLTPATRAEADAGLIILQSDQAHAMSGSNAMCATTALLETGMVSVTEPETRVTFDTAAGLVPALARCRDGRCERVTLQMPPAFVDSLDLFIATVDWGVLHYDVCFGGVFYALVDVTQLGLKIEPASARMLAETGVRLRAEINQTCTVRHPEIPEIEGIAYLMFYDREDDGVIRTCTTLRPGRVDRSPCGTGSNATIAALHERGLLTPGDTQLFRSIIGGEFETCLIDTTEVAQHAATVATVSGRCWIYGLSQMGLDPEDPYPEGFVLADTWGPLVN